jgi:hypothetical protein
MSDMIELIDQVIEEKLNEADKYITEVVDPIADVGSPEKVMGKKYNQWSLEDKQRAGEIFKNSPETLNKFIFNREFQNLKELEAGV